MAKTRRMACCGKLAVAVVATGAAFLAGGVEGFMAPATALRATRSSGATAAKAGVVRMAAGLPSDFDPMSPTLDHLSIIDRAGKSRVNPTMIGGADGIDAGYDPDHRDSAGARVGPPPDLPSLLLHNRIVYLGMPLVPAVTELIMAELLYLNYESSSKPIYMYINTPGTSTPDGRAIGFETEAFAISDTMNYIRPPVYTIAVGQAFGLGAMLLASGEPGHRSALPNASIMLHQPRSMARGQASDIAIKAKEVMANRKTATTMLASACGKTYDQVLEDSSRTFYMSPEEALEYGLIDQVLTERGGLVIERKPKFLESLAF